MSTPDLIGSVLFGRTRRAILSLVFTRPDESFYLREIVRRTGSSPGAVQRELGQLTACGILCRKNGKFYTANPDSVVFEPLKQLVVRTVGLGDTLRKALKRIEGRIGVAFLFGSFARGQQHSDSDVDLMIVARDQALALEEVAAALSKGQQSLGREINPFVLPAGEFRQKWRDGNHFIRRVVEGEKFFLIGGEDELERLAKQRLVEGAPDKPRRNRRSSVTGRA